MMKLIRIICAAVLSVLLMAAAPLPQNISVHAETAAYVTEETEFVTYSMKDGEPAEEPEMDEETQRRNAIMYLMPSIVIAVVLTFMVMRQKIENRSRNR